MTTLFTLLRTAFYMTAFVGLWAWLAFEVRALDGALGLPMLPTWLSTLGPALLIVGGVVALACGLEFSIRGRGTPALFDAPREFVASGPYRFVRNPMYVGAITAFVGLALELRSASVAALAALFGLLVHLLVVYYEEPELEKRFGPSYAEYRKRVHRWIPFAREA
jgi:protein-S-isoprenylcysteine O-methyltransferase Ste14